MIKTFKYYLVKCKKCLKDTKVNPDEFRKTNKSKIICDDCLNKLLKSFKKIKFL